MMNKKAYEFSFSWFFAIIAGAVILFLALYATTKLVGTYRLQQDTLRGKEIEVLLSPLETNLEGTRGVVITVPQETRISNRCDENSKFGSQYISASIKSSIGKEWEISPGAESSTHNKYLFSAKTTEGKKEFYALSKQFGFPFKIADLIIVWSDKENYCFVSPPQEIEEDIKEITQDNIIKNLISVNSEAECSQDSIKVCFRETGCSIDVSLGSKSVTKNGKTVYYAESFGKEEEKYSLLYASIFSEQEIYECQIKRLAKRASEIASLNKEKSLYLTSKGCSSSPILPSALTEYIAKTQLVISAKNSLELKTQLNALGSSADSLKNKNDQLRCRLF
ncbi:MAG: hypothetical protein AABX73_02875 [Nanoarchaeota archaeon]